MKLNIQNIVNSFLFTANTFQLTEILARMVTISK
jgi:hypothetical protein